MAHGERHAVLVHQLEELLVEIGEDVEDVERHPAAGEHDPDADEQHVGLALALCLAQISTLLEHGGDDDRGPLVDHAVLELVADARVRHRHDGDGHEVLEDHRRDGVGALLVVQARVLDAHPVQDDARVRLDAVRHVEDEQRTGHEQRDDPNGHQGHHRAVVLHVALRRVHDHLAPRTIIVSRLSCIDIGYHQVNV